MKYNCNWVYSIFPTRVEFQATDRETGDILFDITLAEFEAYRELLNNDMDFIALQFVEEYGIKIFRYEKVIHRNATNYVGKGTYIKEEN